MTSKNNLTATKFDKSQEALSGRFSERWRTTVFSRQASHAATCSVARTRRTGNLPRRRARPAPAPFCAVRQNRPRRAHRKRSWSRLSKSSVISSRRQPTGWMWIHAANSAAVAGASPSMSNTPRLHAAAKAREWTYPGARLIPSPESLCGVKFIGWALHFLVSCQVAVSEREPLARVASSLWLSSDLEVACHWLHPTEAQGDAQREEMHRDR